jgi:hypothetical protein
MGAEGPDLLGEPAAGSESGRLVPEQLVRPRTLLVLSMMVAQSAGRRIISYPQWSDRAIAKVCGLSVKTVGSLRQRMTAELPQLDARVGRDGRARPLKFAAEDSSQRTDKRESGGIAAGMG